MSRSATLKNSRSSIKPLAFGISLIVLAVVVAIIAARPGSRSDPPALPAAATLPAVMAPGTLPAVASTPTPAGLTARESRFDFGSISMAAGNVSHRYWFKNEGATPVQIQKVYTSCMCTAATLVKGGRVIGRYGMPGHGPLPAVNETLAPSEAAYVDVVFDPAAHGPAGLGRTERVVTIEQGAGAPLRLAFTANVTP